MKAVILIHGFCTNELDFGPIVPELEKIYDRVYLYIIPGHQIPPKYSEFKVKPTFENLLAAYDKLEAEYDTIDCIGFSMGGALATYLQSVKKIHRLVLLSPANKYLNFNLFSNRIKYKTECYAILKKAKNNQEELYERVANKLKNLNEDDIKAVKLGLKELLPHYTIRNVSTFASVINRCNKELININPPTLIIWGKLDQLVPQASIEYLESIAVNTCKIVIMDGLSHLMLRSSKAEKIMKIVLKFLKEEE